MAIRFLYLAYSLVWVIFGIYAWSLSRRQAALKRELEDLRRSGSKTPDPASKV
ncbi:MAG: CcmD family protein [Terriglobia bacterium]